MSGRHHIEFNVVVVAAPVVVFVDPVELNGLSDILAQIVRLRRNQIQTYGLACARWQETG